MLADVRLFIHFSQLSFRDQNFYSDWDKAEFGVLVGKDRSCVSRSDFGMKLLSLVEAGKDTGYFFKIKRQLDQVER